MLNKLAVDNLRPETRAVAMLPLLHCDLTHITSYSRERSKGLLRLQHEPPLSDLFNVITARDQ